MFNDMAPIGAETELEQKLSNLENRGVDPKICFYFMMNDCKGCKTYHEPGYYHGCGFGDFTSVIEAVSRDSRNYAGLLEELEKKGR